MSATWLSLDQSRGLLLQLLTAGEAGSPTTQTKENSAHITLPTLGVRAFKKNNPKAQGGFLSLQQYTNERGCYTTMVSPKESTFASLSHAAHKLLAKPTYPLKSPFTNKLYGHMCEIILQNTPNKSRFSTNRFLCLYQPQQFQI